MAYDFPNSPTLGQAYGNYVWDGEKWQLPTGPSPDRATIYAAPFDAMAYNGMQVNGSMEVSQEFGTAGTNVSGKYPCDGWALGFLGTMAITAWSDLSGSVAGITNFLYCNVQTAQASMGAGDYAMVSQMIEGYRVSRLAWGTASAQPITIGFWTQHARAGTYSVTIRNVPATHSCAMMYTQSVANALEYKTVTFPGPTVGTWVKDNMRGLHVMFSYGCGTTFSAPSAGSWLAGNYLAGPGQVNAVAATSDVMRITGVVVLPGIEAPSAARSPLIMRPYDQELVTCQRYYSQLGGTSAATIGLGLFYSTTLGLFPLQYIVPMRAPPTLTMSALADFICVGATGNMLTLTGITASGANNRTVRLDITGTAGGVAGQAATVQSSTATGTLRFDARL